VTGLELFVFAARAVLALVLMVCAVGFVIGVADAAQGEPGEHRGAGLVVWSMLFAAWGSLGLWALSWAAS
jgi:hypothetical protein